MKKLIKRAAVFSGMLAAIGTLGVGAAQALPGGPWASSSAPLTAYTSGFPAAAAYGTFQGYREDQGRGSRIQNAAWFREPIHVQTAHGAFVNHHWYTNGAFCYVSSLSSSSASVACTSGWHDTGNENRTGTNSTTSWRYQETWKAVDPTANSMRARIFTCDDIPWQSDPCSPSIVRGASY